MEMAILALITRSKLIWLVTVFVSFVGLLEYLLPFVTSQGFRRLEVRMESSRLHYVEYITAPSKANLESMGADSLSWRSAKDGATIDIPIAVWRFPISYRIARKIQFRGIALRSNSSEATVFADIPVDPSLSVIHLQRDLNEVLSVSFSSKNE